MHTVSEPKIVNGEATLNTLDQEKSVYRGSKEYDPGYVWGQLIGWFKQTVDKPNASLSADRRGTLSMPDLESFIISAKNQEDLKSGIIRKKKKKGDEDDDSMEEESIIINQRSNGSRSRPGKNNSCSASSSRIDKEEIKEMQQEISTASKVYQDVKIIYPHKKH
jgi:hypothetical protein